MLSSIFGVLTIFPGLNRLPGSKACLISFKASLILGPNCHWIHSPRQIPSPCSPLNAPLYLRTNSEASWAISRILLAPSRRISRIGRTCRVPTEAWAYQVPRVWCLAKTSVSDWVYCARCSKGTAQSSIKLTGLPSPLRLIIIFRPALRTSHRFFWALGSSISTTEPGKPKSAMSSPNSFTFFSRGANSSPENSTSKMASGDFPPWSMSAVSIVDLNAGLLRERSSIVRSTNSTALGPSLTICWAESMAL